MDCQNNFYNKNSFHCFLIKQSKFCSICSDYSNHNAINCPHKCNICNGFHKIQDHRCLVCNMKNPNHNSYECKYINLNTEKHM